MVKHMKVKVGMIQCDRSYQRPLEAPRVTSMASQFNWDLVGALELSQRPDGSFWVVDGQHRLFTIKQAVGDEAEVMCVVHHGLSVRDEAKLFRELNKLRKVVGALADFHAAVTQKDKTACEIAKMVAKFGLSVQGSYEWNNVRAIQSVIYAHSRNENLEQCLRILTAWDSHKRDHDPAVFDQNVIRTLSDFCSAFPDMDEVHLVSRLDTLQPSRVIALIRRAKKENNGVMTTWVAAANVFRGIYNQMGRGGRRNIAKLAPIE